MPIIPVLDLMIGQIVLAQCGDRATYRPVHSKLTNSSEPLTVAKAIFNQTGCDWLYLADIDSFAGATPNWAVYNQLLNQGYGLWVDADWLSGDRCDQIVRRIDQTKKLKIIVSSETMSDTDQFENFKKIIQHGITPIFSLDQKGETTITRPGPMSQHSQIELIELAYHQGVRDLIVLNLESVGSMHGVAASCDAIKQLSDVLASNFADLRLISGGGVRNAEDIQALINAGCDDVLVASAIHDCRLTPFDVAEILALSH